jgi:hypothetical protein
MTTAVGRAVDAVAEAVVALRRQAGRRADDDGDLRDADAPVVKIGLAANTIAAIDRRWPLTPAYREFLGAHSSHDFVDAGLRCDARAVWLSAATSVVELTEAQREASGWAPHWLVCAVDGDGCYVLDLDERSGEDCPVLYVPGDQRKVERVSPGFVAFLMKIARDSTPTRAVREDRSKAGPPGLAWSRRRDAEAAAGEPDDRRQMIVPVLLAVLAAVLLWWLR